LYCYTEDFNGESKEDNMQYNDTEIDAVFFTPKKKAPKARKWREIEEIKAQQQLTRELREIDPSFVFSLTELGYPNSCSL
jgi:hypothetical protein